MAAASTRSLAVAVVATMAAIALTATAVIAQAPTDTQFTGCLKNGTLSQVATGDAVSYTHLRAHET